MTTTQEVASLKLEIAADYSRLETSLTDKLNQQTRTLLLGMSAMMAATISAVSALLSFNH